jgi:hypothetical protein
VHGAIQGAGITLLKIRTTASANEQSVPGEHHPCLGAHEAQTPIGVAGRFADLELMSSEVNSVSLFDLSVGAHHASALGNHGFGTEVLAQQTTAGHVIGVHVCVEYIHQFEL